MEIESSLHEQLYNILTNDRSKLPSFLEQNGSYNSLKNIIKKLEIHYEKDHPNEHLWKDLLLGKVGNESNKQKAIYELPTKELINSISIVCTLLGITDVEEIMAGQGLLSKIINDNTELNVCATDGDRWIECIGQPKYYSVESKLVLEYITNSNNNTLFNKTLIIISWIAKNSLNDFIKFINKETPPYIMVLGDNNKDKKFNIYLRHLGIKYFKIEIPIKQISYKDYFHNNIVRNENICYSTMTLYIKRTTCSNALELFDEYMLPDIFESNMCELLQIYTDKILIQDLIIAGKLPHSMLNYINTPLFNELKQICKEYLLFKNKLHMQFIETIEEFRFFVNKMKKKLYPISSINIRSRTKFLEYKQLVESDIHNNMVTLIRKGVLPYWISNIDDAEAFLFLDYSLKDKKWKENISTFRTKLHQYQNNSLFI